MRPTDERTISIVVPVYNEEAVIDRFHEAVAAVLSTISYRVEILFVNDGSVDRSSEVLRSISVRDPRVRIIELSRNFGHQPAISAGMERAVGDAIIVMDADLQDPPSVIPLMVERWEAGFHVVHARRRRRRGEGLLKRGSAAVFYRLLDRLSDVPLHRDVGDFRLIDAVVRDQLSTLPEHHRYVRGLISWLGYRTTTVEFDRAPRAAGATKYPLRKMLAFAGEAVTGFSTKPLRVSTILGFLLAAAGVIYLGVVVATKLFSDQAIPGWASIMAVTLLFHGFAQISIGIQGVYVSRIYDEVKGRPNFVVAADSAAVGLNPGLREDTGAPGGELPPAATKPIPAAVAGSLEEPSLGVRHA